MGEISTSCYADIPEIVRSVVTSAGYNESQCGFDGNTCAVITSINKQSGDIALGVNASLEKKSGEFCKENQIGAGDQGMMFGFACDETSELMPLPIVLAHRLARRLSDVREEKILKYLKPDGKTQVTVEYEDGRPGRIDAIVVSAQHAEEIDIKKLISDIKEYVVYAAVPADMLDNNTKIFINPTGRFVSGGPACDSGLTGRKIMVDTYGGYARHGGGGFSGKDATKVDRSAAYAARHIAKNIVGAKLAGKCEVQTAYAIGVAHPVSVMVETFGTGIVGDDVLEKAIKEIFDLRPSSIIKNLDLTLPIYSKLAVYGHMGREDLGVKWEKLDKTEDLLEYTKKITE
jgi:S-adenosylmethionine synthetase